MTTDAKVFAMIDDLSRGALLALLDKPITEEHSHHYLTSAVRQQYEAGQITGDSIVAEWQDDEQT